MRVTQHFLALVFVVVLIAACSNKPVSQINSTADGIAVKGYDVVAYFTDGKPVRGSMSHHFQWMGATWQFSSKEHQELFSKAPEKYAPQYGGYCAYAVSRGTTADIDPDAWNIVDGKLYLNLSKPVQGEWKKDIPGNIEKADRNWPGVLGK